MDTNGGLNDRADELTAMAGEGVHPKYYSSVIDEQHHKSMTPMGGGTRADSSVNQMMMMNMVSIDSNSEFANVSISASNTLNNKKNRKLKRAGGPNGQQHTLPSDTNVAFIDDGQFVQSQSFYNEGTTNGHGNSSSQADSSITGQAADERRAKSSMGNGESSAGRLRNKIAGV